MAILVSNPSTVQFTGAPAEPQDPSVIPLDAGFTEELANAMQPSPQMTEGTNQAQKQLATVIDAKLNDLQILPPEVLLNAVGEANFAFTSQVVPASEEAVLTQDTSAVLTDPALLNPLNISQAAELVASALAAQMVTQVPVPNNAVLLSQVTVATGAVGAPGPVDADSAALAEGAQLGEAPTLQNASIVSQQPVLNPSSFANSLESSAVPESPTANTSNLNLTQSFEEPQVASQQSANASMQLSVATNVIGASEALTTKISTSALPQQLSSVPSQQLSSSDPADQSNTISNGPLNASEPLLDQVSPSSVDVAQVSIATQGVKSGKPGHLSVNSDTAMLQSESATEIKRSAFDLAKGDVAKPVDPYTSVVNQSSVMEPSYQDIASLDTDKTGFVGQENGVINTADNDELTGVQMGSSIRIAGDAPLQNTKPETNDEASFKFDAKLGGQLLKEGIAPNTNLSKPVSLGGEAVTKVTDSISATMGASMVPSAQQDQDLLDRPEVLVSSIYSVQNDASEVNPLESESRQSAVMGFSEVSTTFVSTLVGGPQRPITTVMDWVALKPQEPPRPVMPHELRLDAGAVQVEIQRMVKQGGGHVVMELTPPDQSKFTIELKLDDNGSAYLRVEGVSDSTKTRLEQSAPQLQEQFQQMGLNLQLDMRQNRDSSSSGSANWMPNEPGFNNNLPQEATAQTNRAVAAERAHNQNGGQVFLYA
jgi:hypothetical protein